MKKSGQVTWVAGTDSPSQSGSSGQDREGAKLWRRERRFGMCSPAKQSNRGPIKCSHEAFGGDPTEARDSKHGASNGRAPETIRWVRRRHWPAPSASVCSLLRCFWLCVWLLGRASSLVSCCPFTVRACPPFQRPFVLPHLPCMRPNAPSILPCTTCLVYAVPSGPSSYHRFIIPHCWAGQRSPANSQHAMPAPVINDGASPPHSSNPIHPSCL